MAPLSARNWLRFILFSPLAGRVSHEDQTVATITNGPAPHTAHRHHTQLLFQIKLLSTNVPTEDLVVVYFNIFGESKYFFATQFTWRESCAIVCAPVGGQVIPYQCGLAPCSIKQAPSSAARQISLYTLHIWSWSWAGVTRGQCGTGGYTTLEKQRVVHLAHCKQVYEKITKYFWWVVCELIA